MFDNGGLIDIVKGAKNDAEDLVQSEDKKMNDLLQEYANIMGGEVEIPEPDQGWHYDEDGNVTNGEVTLKIGDYVNYDYQDGASVTEYESPSDYSCTTCKLIISDDILWQILGVDEKTNEILLISSRSIGFYTNARGEFTGSAYGKAVYTNFPEDLNKMCSMYGQGKFASGARSINLNDINRLTGYNPKNVGVYDPMQTGNGKRAYEGLITEYGCEVTHYWRGVSSDSYGQLYVTSSNGTFSNRKNLLYPIVNRDSVNPWWDNIFEYYDNGGKTWKNSYVSTTATDLSMEKITSYVSNDYNYYVSTLEESGEGNTVGLKPESVIYNMLANQVIYFIANVSQKPSDGGEGDIIYKTYYLADGKVYSTQVYHSAGYYTKSNPARLRPVVSLQSDVKLEDSGTLQNNCTSWNIVGIE